MISQKFSSRLWRSRTIKFSLKIWLAPSALGYKKIQVRFVIRYIYHDFSNKSSFAPSALRHYQHLFLIMACTFGALIFTKYDYGLLQKYLLRLGLYQTLNMEKKSGNSKPTREWLPWRKIIKVLEIDRQIIDKPYRSFNVMIHFKRPFQVMKIEGYLRLRPQKYLSYDFTLIW